MEPKRLLVEGWRGISQSFAMANQYQLLAWIQTPGLNVFCRDVPMHKPHWNSNVQSAGFDDESCARLSALRDFTDPRDQKVDAIYRIAFPAALSPTHASDTPQFTFIVNEFGLTQAYFCDSLPDLGMLTRDGNAVITPSTWSRDLLIDFGVDARRLHLVPLGVCRKTFAPMPDTERLAVREATGFGDQDFIFSNVGVATWNKGIDQLLIAFARVRGRHPNARLILKNHQSLYAFEVAPVFDEVNRSHPGLLSTDVMRSITLIDDNMTREDLRKLYVCTDCYVSPYRAEGFNIPVLEAMACGTPAIVTAGGATDDFCDDEAAVRVDSVVRRLPDHQLRGGLYLEIDGEALFEAMSSQLARGGQRLSGAAWDQKLENMTWRRVAQQALEVMFPNSTAACHAPTASTKVTSEPDGHHAAMRSAQPARGEANLPQPGRAAVPPLAPLSIPAAAAAPDFYNPVYYSIPKRKWLLRTFPGVERIQGNHSQLHQDMFVLAALDGLRGGSYLDIGAHEPIFINNTHLLESVFDWRGVSIELDEGLVARHRSLRRNPCHCRDATQVDYDALLSASGIGPVVDYLSVDTDPPQVTLAALKKLPHDKYRFRVITFEHDFSAGGEVVRAESRDFLNALGYTLVVSDVAWGNRIVEDWWVHPALTDATVVARLICAEGQAHEHDKYIYGGYHAGWR